MDFDALSYLHQTSARAENSDQSSNCASSSEKVELIPVHPDTDGSRVSGA